MAILRWVRDGRYVRDSSGVWRGPHGTCHDDADQERLLGQLAEADPAEVEAAIHSLDRW